MTLVDRNVQGRLSPLVPGVEVGPGVGEKLHDRGLVSKGRVVNSAIPVFVLDLQLSLVPDQGAYDLQEGEGGKNAKNPDRAARK